MGSAWDATAAAPASAASAPVSAWDATPATAPAAPARGVLDQLGDAASAFGHHVLNLPHGVAQLVENGAAKVAGLLPDNSVSRAIQSTAAADNQAMTDRENAYQASTPTDIGSGAGAFLGEVAPMLVGGVGAGLQKIGDAFAERFVPSWAGQTGARIASGAAQGGIVGAGQPVATPAPTLGSLVTPGGAPAAPMSYDEYLKAFDAAPDEATKVQLGNQYAASVQAQQDGYWSQKAGQITAGAALGGAVTAAVSGLQGAAGAARSAAAPILNPNSVVAPALADWATAGGQIPIEDAIAALRAPTQLVPGSTPTTAQVLGGPQIVAAEKAVSNNPAFKPQFDQRAVDNNAARWNVINGVAQTPDALQAAVDARAATTQPMLDKLFSDPTTSQPVLASDVLSKIGQIDNSSFSTDPVISRTLGALRGQISDAAAKTDINAYTFTPSQLAGLKDAPYVRADLLDGIRQNLRGTLRDNASDGIVSSKQSAGLEPLADHISSAIDAVNPGYRDYLAAYAQGSQPISTMEAAGRIADNLGGRAADASGAAQLTLSGYRSQLAQALARSPYAIDPQAQAALEGVQSDLQRASISNSVRAPGSDTAYNLQAPGWLASKLYGSDFSGTPAAAKLAGGALGGIGGFLTGGGFGAAGGATAGAALASKVSELGQSRVNAALARALLDPSAAASLLEQHAAPAVASKTAAAAAMLSQKSPQLGMLLGQALQGSDQNALQPQTLPR